MYLSENSNVAFSGTNAIQIADVDANGGKELVTLTVTNGVLDLTNLAPVTVTAGSNGTGSKRNFIRHGSAIK